MENKIIQELLKAQSALNCYPNPITPQYSPYLSGSDHNAHDAYKHIDEAIKMLIEQEKQQ